MSRISFPHLSGQHSVSLGSGGLLSGQVCEISSDQGVGLGLFGLFSTLILGGVYLD